MTELRYGTAQVNKLYAGANEISRLYVGSSMVWEPEDPDPPSGPEIVGSIFANQNSGQSSMAMPLPSGLEDGDRLFLFAISTDTNAGSAITETLPSGWSTITAKADQGTMQRALYTALYSGSLSAPSWSLVASRRNAYGCVAVRNAAVSPLANHAHPPSSSVNSIAPAISDAPAGLILRLFVRKDNTSTSVTDPGSHDVVFKSFGVPTGPVAHVMAYSAEHPSNGNVSTATLAWELASVNSTAWTIVC